MHRIRCIAALAAILIALPALAAGEATPSRAGDATPSPSPSPIATLEGASAAAATPEPPTPTSTPTAAAASVAPRAPAAVLPFDAHGGVLLWQYVPFLRGAKPYASIYAAYLTFDKKMGELSVHLEPRFRDSRLRPFFQTNVWLQEAYVALDLPLGAGTIKAGKEYTRFGYFWDGSFYGNLPYFDGITVDPDIGGSLEGSPEVGAIGVEYALQYFGNDGLTNGSLAGRDSISEGATQRNEGIVRVAPFYRLGEKDKVRLGASWQGYRVEWPTGAPLPASPATTENVSRTEVDASASYAGARAFAEMIWQNGRQLQASTVVGGVPGPGSKKNRYLWAGVGYAWRWLDLRYNVSRATYEDFKYEETVHNPGAVISLDPNLSVMLEYAYWSAKSSGAGASRETIVDRSANVVLIGSF